MADYDGSIRINTKIDTKDASSQLLSLWNQMQKTADKIASLRSKMDSLKDVKIPTEEYKSIQADIAKAEKELEKLLEKQAQMQNEGKTSGSAWDLLVQKIQASKDYIETAKSELQGLVDTGKAFTLGQDTSEYERLGQQLGYEENNLQRLNRRLEEVQERQGGVAQRFSQMRGSARRAFDAMNDGANQVNVSFSKMFRMILKYGFGIRSFYFLVNKFRAAVKEGFSNLAQVSAPVNSSLSMLMSALAQLKNSLATAFAPILNVIAPALTSFINMISKAATYVGMFIALLTGASSFTKAVAVQKDYAASLNKTAGAAKKALGALARFDDLDVLQKKEDDGGGLEISPEDMFEEVPIDPKLKKWLDDISLKLKPILDYLKELRDIFMQGFWDGLGDWEYRWNIIKESIASIKKSLIDIFTDPAVVAAADRWAKSVAYMLGSLVGSIASIGLTIAANLLGGMAKYLEENKERIKGYLVSMFDIWADVNMLLAGLFQSIAYVFEAFASENGINLTANLIGIFADAFMGVTEIVSKLARDILNIFITPFVENRDAFRTALEGFLGVLESVTKTVKDSIDETFDNMNKMYDEHFKPFFDSVSEGLTDLSEQYLEKWNTIINPILEEWAKKIDTLWDAHTQPVFNSMIELLGSVADLLMLLWEGVLQPLMSWVIDNILPPIMMVIDGIVTNFTWLTGVAEDVATAIIESFRALIDFFVGIFRTDFNTAWNGLVEDMKSIGTNLIEGLKKGFHDSWDSLLGTVEEMSNDVINKFKEVLGIHSPSTVMEENGVYMVEGLENGIASSIDNVYALFSPDTWTELGQNMFAALMATVEEFKALWLESFTLWQEENLELFFGYDLWYEQWYQFMQAYLDVNELFMAEWFTNIENWWSTMVTPYFEIAKWKTFGDNMRTGIMTGFKTIVNEIAGVLNHVITLFNSGYKQLQDAMNALIDDYNAKAAIMGTATLGHVSYSPMPMLKVPALASGAVIRGGNPFIAILGDQPRGQTNIEAPLATIEQALENVMGRNGYGGGERVPVNINLNYDGETFARLSISDILSELGRQGYNVEVLGET